MTLFTFYPFYVLFCLHMLERVFIVGGQSASHESLIQSSCILNTCGTRDDRGIVTICEDTKIGDLECPDSPELGSTNSEELKSKSLKKICEETNGGSCSEDHTEEKNIASEENSGNRTMEKNFASLSYSNEIRAQLLSTLQELMSNGAFINWPTDYFITADDTLYHVIIKEDCDGQVSYGGNKYLPIRAYVNQQLNTIDTKSSLGEERHKRKKKRFSPRYATKVRRFRQSDDQENIHHNNHIDEQEKETLENVYGKKTFSEHESDFEQVGKMGQHDNGAIEHKLSTVNNQINENMDDIADQARMDAVNDVASSEKEKDGDAQLDSGMVKTMLKELLHKLDEIEHDPKHSKSTSHGHCNTHGLWLSTVAGAAIELLPDNNGVINTKIVDLPQPPEGALINSHWTGTGMISKESPTTITIVFQEHIPHSHNDNSKPPPRTAVFVGQCLVCDNSPMLQGTWILFPNSQNCFPLADKNNSPASDIMYQIRR